MSPWAAVFGNPSIMSEMESLLFTAADDTGTRDGTGSLAKLCIVSRDLIEPQLVQGHREEAEVRMRMYD